MLINKSIIMNWDEETISKVRQYWEERGFRLESKDVTTFSGTRGDWLSTLISVRHSHVRTKLLISHDRNRLDCSMQVDSRIRTVTLWHRRRLELELATFESFLLTGDRLPEAWDDYHRKSKHAARERALDSLRPLFGREKPDRPMEIGGHLTLGAIALLGFGSLFVLSILAVWLLILPYHVSMSQLPMDLAVVPITSGLLAILFFTLSVSMRRLYKRGQKCINIERAAVKLEIDPAALQKAIELRGVKAKFIMDGEPVYELEDITGAATLLRAVVGTEEAVLLKPVNDVNGSTDALLMRPLDSAEAEINHLTNR
jgi:hypothetical protein